MTTLRTHFTFRVDTWTPDGESIVEHVAGRLVHVLPQWQPRSGIVHAVFPSRRGLLPSVRTLLDFLARECAVRRQLASGAAS